MSRGWIPSEDLHVGDRVLFDQHIFNQDALFAHHETCGGFADFEARIARCEAGPRFLLQQAENNWLTL